MDSMTAYASLDEVLSSDGGRIAWELRGVNHRYLDLTLRLPEGFRPIEAECRRRLRSRLRRGKCELSLRYVPGPLAGRGLDIDEERLDAVLAACRRVADRWSGGDAGLDPLAVLAWPGIVADRAESADAEVQGAALEMLDRLVEDFRRCRRREGGQIEAMLERRCVALLDEVAALRRSLPDLLAAHRKRLEARLAELQGGFDEGRLEQEMALLAQRSDVGEELDRIEAHVGEVRRLLGVDEPVGRRLDFLMQELNREANTLASKATSIETTRSALELKVIVEQMREQIQNVE